MNHQLCDLSGRVALVIGAPKGLDKACVDDSVASTLATFSKIDILVTNASINIRKPVLELLAEEWDMVLNTNLRGYFLMARTVGPAMFSRGRGNVINVASIFGRQIVNNAGCPFPFITTRFRYFLSIATYFLKMGMVVVICRYTSWSCFQPSYPNLGCLFLFLFRSPSYRLPS